MNTLPKPVQMNCSVCSSEVAEDAAFCDACGASLQLKDLEPAAHLPIGFGIAGSSVSESHNAAPKLTFPTLPGTPLLMGDGEVLWRHYRVSRLRRRGKGEGILFVTDARVVFYAVAKGLGTRGQSSLVHQTKVGDVTGLMAYVTHRLSLIWFVTAFIMGVFFLITSFAHIWVGAVIFVLLLGGAVAMLFSGAVRRGSVGVRIYAGITDEGPVNFGQFGERRNPIIQIVQLFTRPFLAMFGIHTAFDVMVGFPDQDAELMIAEIGALIFDLQTRGNLAGTHWGMGSGEVAKDL